MSQHYTDWQGRAITEKEMPDTKIYVWVIEDEHGDEFWIRDYNQALEFATDSFYYLVDLTEKDDLLEGVFIKMRLKETTLQEYEEVCATEYE